MKHALTPSPPSYVLAVPALMNLGMCRASAYKLLNDGVVPAKKMMGRTVTRPEDVAAYANNLPDYAPKRGRPKKASRDIAPWDVVWPGEGSIARTKIDSSLLKDLTNLGLVALRHE